MSPQISQALYVEGMTVGAGWQFNARVFVEDTAGSGDWRKARAGEVECIFHYLGAWWTPVATELERKNTDASGNVSFAGSHHVSGAYTMEAKHILSGDRYKVRIDCQDDGTYDVTTEIE